MNIQRTRWLKKIADRQARKETIRRINRQISNAILQDRMTCLKIYIDSVCAYHWNYLKDNLDFFKSYYIKRGFKVCFFEDNKLFFIDWSETNE